MADLVYPGQPGQVLNQTSLPVNVDLVIYKGDDLEVLVNITDSSSVAVNLTGATATAHMKSDYEDRVPKPFTCTPTGQPGQVKISLSATDTSLLIPGSYIWDFQIKYSNGRVKTYMAGDVTVMNEVTTV